MNRWRQILRKIALPIALAMGTIVLAMQLSLAQSPQRFPLPNNSHRLTRVNLQISISVKATGSEYILSAVTTEAS